MKRPVLAWLTALLLVAPLLAHAADGFATANVNLRAGPDTSYPLIATIPVGTQMAIQGCTDGWEWCDVIAFGNRGWIAGNYLQYNYQNQRVLVPAYGAQIGIPIVSFVIGSYWDSYYRNRPFYRDRSRWYARPIPHRPPPRPIQRPPPRPPVQPRPPSRPTRPPAGNRPPPARPQPGSGVPARPGQGKPGGTRPSRPGQGNPAGGSQRPGSGAGSSRPSPGQQRPTGRPTTKPADSGN